MKKTMILAITIASLATFLFGGCTKTAYAAEVVQEEERLTSGREDPLKEIEIGEKVYALNYTESYLSQLTGKAIDSYASENGEVRVSDGIVVYFSGITPYATLKQTAFSSKETVRSAVESVVPEIDFSVYDSFEFTDTDAVCSAIWSVSGINRSITFLFDKDGKIISMSRTEAEPQGKLNLSAEEKNKLIRSALQEQGIHWNETTKFEIVSETASLYRGEDALLIFLSLSDDGFVQAYAIAIQEK